MVLLHSGKLYHWHEIRLPSVFNSNRTLMLLLESDRDFILVRVHLKLFNIAFSDHSFLGLLVLRLHVVEEAIGDNSISIRHGDADLVQNAGVVSIQSSYHSLRE